MTARCFVWLYQLGGNKQAQGSHGSLEPSLEIHAPSVAQDKYSVLVLVTPHVLGTNPHRGSFFEKIFGLGYCLTGMEATIVEGPKGLESKYHHHHLRQSGGQGGMRCNQSGLAR